MCQIIYGMPQYRDQFRKDTIVTCILMCIFCKGQHNAEPKYTLLFQVTQPFSMIK